MFKRSFILLWEVVKIVAISLAIFLPVRYYLIQPFYVKGASMKPNFSSYQYLIVDEISYRFQSPQRGQIIVFRYPRNPQEYFIKRIIALPGEGIKISNGQIEIFNKLHPQGFVLKENYLFPGTETYSKTTSKITLAKDEYYVLGDNRMASMDSRSFGPVNSSFIIGKVAFRGWPLSKIKIFDNSQLPQYGN